MWTLATRQLVMEGGLSGRTTKCRYCRYPATKWRCHGNHFWLSIYAVYIGATWRIRLNRPCAAAMRPYVKLLWPLVQLLWQCDDAWTKVSNELPATIQLIWCNAYSAILKLTAQTTNNYLNVSTLEYIRPYWKHLFQDQISRIPRNSSIYNQREIEQTGLPFD